LRLWICRVIEWMSAMAAKSRLRRQMNGSSSPRNDLARAMSPAAALALMKAARSQFWPTLW
jgi:hypothetical protein